MTKKSTTYRALSERTRTVLGKFETETGQSAITKAMGIDRTVVSAIINRLHNLHLIECTQVYNPTLKHVQLYKITAAGKRELAEGLVAASPRGPAAKPSQPTVLDDDIREVMSRPVYKTGDGMDWFYRSF